MIVTIRHYTESGSIYEIRRIHGAATETYVRRVKLGELHYKQPPDRLAARVADGLDGWTKVREVESFHNRLWIQFEDEGRNLVTGKVLRTEEV